jgi:pimeloyl-ACP methyl ester carboxylesterase
MLIAERKPLDRLETTMGMQEIELSAGPIHYRDSGSGAPLVFVHGLLVNGSLWRKVTPTLESRFRCVVPDLPLGAHSTPMRETADLSPRGVARLLAELLETLDLEDVTVIANDTGGAIVQILAAEHPERIARLVLTPCDTFENFPPPMFRPLKYAARVPGGLNALLQPLRIRRLRRLPMAFGLLTKRPVPHEVTDSWLRPFFANKSVRRDVCRHLRALDPRDLFDAAERLRSFAPPVLLAWASEDRVFPLDQARRLASVFPNAKLVEIADSYTFVPEDQPQRLAELVAGFASEDRPGT